MGTTIQEAQRLGNIMRIKRTPDKILWGEIEKYVLPRQLDGGSSILDGTGARALRILAQGMMSGLTSPARPWFRLKLTDKHGPETEPERNWLNIVESRIYAALARSNFYPTLQSAYVELAAFGSANIYQEVDNRRLMRFTLVPCGEFWWACSDDGRVNTVVRQFTMTVRQIAECYGEDKMSKRIRRMLHDNPEERVEIVHMVHPRVCSVDVSDSLNPLKMPWESLVWEADAYDSLLHEGGYKEFPHLTPRWDLYGDVSPYGCSPTEELLRHCYKLQELIRSQLLDPDGAAVGHEIEELRASIRKGFYNDFFLAFTRESESKTKQEMDARSEEVLHELSPVIERLQVELLDPLIERTYGMIKRAGMLPAPPCCMEGKALRVEYISPLAEAQRDLAAKKLHSFFMDAQKAFG